MIDDDNLILSDELLSRSLRQIAVDEIHLQAAELRKSDPAISAEAAVAAVVRQHPHLYSMSAAPGADRPLADFLVQKADDARDRQIEEIILKCAEACGGDLDAGLAIVEALWPSLYERWRDSYGARR